MGSIEVEVRIGAGPWWQDHFPGDPLVPGAVLLDEVSEALRRVDGQLGALTGVPQARFLRPVRPPAVLRVQAQRSTGRVDFTVIDAATGAPALRGRFLFELVAAVPDA